MAAEPDDVSMTVEEYLALEEISQIKHEFVNGHVYAMSGGTLDHDTIANNVRAAFLAHISDDLCRPAGPDVRVRVSATIAYYPDALVVCDATLRGADREIHTPRLIVEVLSDSTEANDRGDKFANYQSLASFEEYLLVASRRRAVERFHRSESGLWHYHRYGPDDTVALESVGLSCPVAAFYRRAQV